ncbi:MAG TPA: LamG domain-containing protein [Verrucomicrobiota bacterium]|nr:LamG domain-containing protein [Verrucomicrobiota bacterium]
MWTDGGLDITPNSIPNGEWAQVAVVGESSSGSLRLHTNGVLAGSRAHSLPGPNAFPFNIGGGGIFDAIGENGNYFNGQIDELAVFDKALSGEDIDRLYLIAKGELPISLSVTRQGSQVVLSWPATAVIFRLQSANALPAGNTWTTVPGTPVLSGGLYRITSSVSGAQMYYRLINP